MFDLGKQFAAAAVLVFIFSGCAPRERIISFYPEGTAKRESSIRIKFSVPVMLDRAKINLPLPESEFITFSPPLKGEYRWLTEDTLQFVPNDQLAADTEYTVEVKRTFGTGIDIQGNTRFKFRTEKFAVVAADMRYDFFIFDIGEKNIAVDIAFNYNVEVDQVKRHVRLRRNGNDFPYEISAQISPRRYRLVSANVKKGGEDQRFELVISKELINAESGTALKADVRRTLQLNRIPPFAVLANEVVRQGSENAIVVKFNKIPDEKHLARFIVIPGKVPFRAKVDFSSVVISGQFRFGKNYSVQFKKGLPSVDGSTLADDQNVDVFIPRPEREITFLQQGSLLPIKDDINIFVGSFDVSMLSLEIFRVPNNNIPYLLHDSTLDFLGKIVFSTNVPVNIITNDGAALTEINLKSFIRKYGKGVYRMRIMDSSQGSPRVEKWVLGTDIGLITKEDGDDLIVFAGSLRTFRPLPGVKIALVNREGAETSVKTSDGEGFATFSRYKNDSGDVLPWLITAASDDDYAYLYFPECKVNFTQSDIEGAPFVPGSLEAFVYPSRDLFRPGESIHLAAVVKKIGGGKLKNFPVRLKVTGPESLPVYEENAVLNAVGMTDFSFKLPSQIRTGVYEAAIFIGNDLAIGSTQFKIEEFIPQTLKVEIDILSRDPKPGTEFKFNVSGKSLFGTAASKRRVLAHVRFSYLPFHPAGYDGFSFENDRFSYREQKMDLSETVLDDAGIAKYECAVPAESIPFGFIKAQIYAEVQENGGRTVAVMKNTTISDKPYYLGIKKTGNQFAGTDSPAVFEIAAVSASGKPATVRNVSVYIVKSGWNNIYQKARWQKSGNYDATEFQDIVLRNTIPVVNGKAMFSFQHQSLGAYEIIAIQEQEKVSANLRYAVGGFGDVTMNLAEADQLKLQLNKEKYDIGDTAVLSVQTPFKGLLMLTVEREKVLYRTVLPITRTSQLVSLPVRKDYIPNAYIVGMLFRSYDDINALMPARAYAALPINVNRDTGRLKVNLTVPRTIVPNSTIYANVSIPNSDGDTYLTLSAVEEGVLDITDFHVPRVFDFFMRKRMLSVNSYDTFSHIINRLPNLIGDITIGGDGNYEISQKHHSPLQLRKRETVALWSGVVKAENGSATIPVAIGNYNGSVRFMAVAASDNRFGSSETSAPVFAPIVIQPTAPRTIAPNDTVSVPVSVVNKTGSNAAIALSVTVEGPLSLVGLNRRSAPVPPDGEAVFDFRFKAKEMVGNATLVFSAGDGTREAVMKESIGVRPASVKETRVWSGIVRSDKKRRVGQSRDFYQESRRGAVQVSPYTEAEHLGRLDMLMRYPYGCLEQKISIAFPQLYIADIAAVVAPFMYRNKRQDTYVNEGIRSAELASGYNGFAVWPGHTGNTYLQIYTAHFLAEAKNKGYAVKPGVYSRAVDHVKKYIKNTLSEGLGDHEIFTITYGLYMLAVAREPLRENMEYVKDYLLKDNVNILCWLYLAAAYSKTGDKDTAAKLLKKRSAVIFPENFSWWGNPYLSDTSAISILLLTLMEIEPSHPRIRTYLDLLTEKYRGDFQPNTHELALSLQVFGRYFTGNLKGAVSGTLAYAGKTVPLTGGTFIHEHTGLVGSEIVLQNTGREPIYFSALAEGYPVEQIVAQADRSGVDVGSEYFDANGKALDMKNVPQSSLAVQKVTVAGDSGSLVAVVLFSGGFELENPRLTRSQELAWLPENAVQQSDYLDIRDDRIIIFLDHNAEQSTRTYYFAYRAVFPGEFIVPSVFAENMYRPEIHGRTKSETVFIADKEH